MEQSTFFQIGLANYKFYIRKASTLIAGGVKTGLDQA